MLFTKPIAPNAQAGTYQVRYGCEHHNTDCECGGGEVFTFKSSVFVNGRKVDAGYGTFEAQDVQPCPSCNVGRCQVLGAWSTGEKLLSGYTPQVGELVRNIYMKCVCCGWDQAS